MSAGEWGRVRETRETGAAPVGRDAAGLGTEAVETVTG
jgi:hypothetical protein